MIAVGTSFFPEGVIGLFPNQTAVLSCINNISNATKWCLDTEPSGQTTESFIHHENKIGFTCHLGPNIDIVLVQTSPFISSAHVVFQASLNGSTISCTRFLGKSPSEKNVGTQCGPTMTTP